MMATLEVISSLHTAYDESRNLFLVRCDGLCGKGRTREEAHRDWLAKRQAVMQEDRDF